MEILFEGKSKVIYKGLDEDSLILHYKDTVTAYNGEKTEDIFGKGKLNAAISSLIYDYLAKNWVETHVIKQLAEDRLLVKKAEIVAVEVVVRNLAAGSFSKKYGIPEGASLKNVALEFCLKDDALGDPMINLSQITAIGIATEDELRAISARAFRINDLLYPLFEKAGLRLVDFKLEFGRCDGKILLCDEISPDSCRIWDIATDAKLDKDRFRQGLGNLIESYREVLNRLLAVVD